MIDRVTLRDFLDALPACLTLAGLFCGLMAAHVFADELRILRDGLLHIIF